MRCLLSVLLSRSVIPKEVQAASLSPAGSVCVGQASLPSFLLFWDFWGLAQVGSGQDWCGKSHGGAASEDFILQGIHSPPGMGLPQFPWDVLVLGKGTGGFTSGHSLSTLIRLYSGICFWVFWALFLRCWWSDRR